MFRRSLLGFGLVFTALAPVSANTIDTALIPATWLQDRIYETVNVDASGVILSLNTGEKIRKVNVRPVHWVKAAGLDGQLCTERDCKGDAPSMVELYLTKPQHYQGQVRNNDKTSIVTVVTNGGNTYQFKVRPSKARRRRYKITKE